jgi:hypothetical protein
MPVKITASKMTEGTHPQVVAVFDVVGQDYEEAVKRLYDVVDEFLNENCTDNESYDEMLDEMTAMGAVSWLVRDGFSLAIDVYKE